VSTLTHTRHDIRTYPSGQIVNNTLPNLPTHPGHIAPAGNDYVWIAHTSPAQGGTADTENNALNAVLDAWMQA